MATTHQVSSLHEKIPRENRIPRLIELLILSLLFSLLVYRLTTLKHHGNEWLIALLCESCFTLIWFLVVCIKWNQVDFKTYPDRLLQSAITELPPVDMFVTTADPILEPPIITVNTVLSLLAVDYPTNKLACYISDDACSPLTYYSLVEAAKFARLWVPFCKKYGIQTRAPFRYFTPISSSLPNNTSFDFQQDWTMLKDEYGQLCKKIEQATHDSKSIPKELKGDLAAFSDVERTNHPAIVKVITEKWEDNADGIPCVVYVSREKRPKHPHHFKAGAMNVLTRVSGVMTNAPFMLNVDCDMYANNPQIILHAMCVLLGDHNDREIAFAQFPQYFYDGLKDDPYGNQHVVLQKILMNGIAGIQGCFYQGTGCIHRRKVIYGLLPNEKVKYTDGELLQKFGRSRELANSAAQAILGLNLETGDEHIPSNFIEALEQVAGCKYEYGTSWGKEVGWIYGSQTEDVLTGLTIHRRGWRSAYCTPDPPAFIGSAPSGGPETLIQTKRWSTGLLEILFSSNSPIVATLIGKLSIRQSFAYVWLQIWALRSIPEICYACLPAYCIITNSHFLPKVNDPAILLPIAIFVIYSTYTLLEYVWIGQPVRAWWNNQRMVRINCMTAWLFGLLSVMLKLLGISETVFEVTQKDQNNSGDQEANANANAGRFTFNESTVFVPGTAILLVNLTALVIGLLGLRRGTFQGNGSGIGEFICSVWVLVCFWAFLKGLFGTGKHGIPSSTICKSGALALLFVYTSKWLSMR